MDKALIDIDTVIFSYVSYIKRFHEFLVRKYELTDIPYNVCGKMFPKFGSFLIDGHAIKYQFHGRGCSFYWNNIEVIYNVDAGSKNQILLGGYGLLKFMVSSEVITEELSFDETMVILNDCECRGVFMRRKPNDLGSFHVNEVWYEYHSLGKEFNGENKDDIDW